MAQLMMLGGKSTPVGGGGGVVASGGTVSYSGSYKIHTFTADGTFTVTTGGDVDVLLIGGGGGAGGGYYAGGGGAGGMQEIGDRSVTAQAYSVVVGDGGSGGTVNNTAGTSGDASTFDGLSSAGGGYGTGVSNAAGASGGSGGGGASNTGAAGSGNTPSTTPSQGNDAGAGNSTGGGGGGGAGGAGTTNDGSNTNGGAGSSNSYSGSAVTYAAGGNGSTHLGTGDSGSANTGDGGSANVSNQPGGTGGSGVVIVRYQASYTPTVVDSLMLDSGANQYLSFTPAAGGDTRLGGFEGWIKVGKSADQVLYSAGTSSSSYINVRLDGNRKLSITSENPGLICQLITDMVFRDHSGWYFVKVTWDTEQATAADRMQIEVNGVVQTLSTATYPAQNTDLLFNSNTVHVIGRRQSAGDVYYDGYIAMPYVWDGQVPADNTTTETDANGQLVPKTFSGSFGARDRLYAFGDSGALGDDTSGNGLDATLNGGIGADNQVTDSPSAGYNYCVLNPLSAGSNVVLSEGNLHVSSASNSNAVAMGTIPITVKSYFEFTLGNADNIAGIADIDISHATDSYVGSSASGYGYYFVSTASDIYNSGSAGAYGTSLKAAAIGDVVGVAFDPDNLKLYFRVNGTWVNSADPGAGTGGHTVSAGNYAPAVGNQTHSGDVNFGQRDFEDAAPTGFLPLNTGNLEDPAITDPSLHFDIDTFTGTGANNERSTLSFQPDMLWNKRRSGASQDHNLFDAVRGAPLQLYSSGTYAEGNDSTTLVSFDADGYTVGSSQNTNNSGDTYVTWAWKMSATAGMDIQAFTGDPSSTQEVDHDLGVVPEFILVKRRSDTGSWITYHVELGETKYLKLDDTTASTTNAGAWNNVAPTSLVFTAGTYINSNTHTYIAYLFTGIPGFSKFGSFSSSNAAIFLHLGFRPRWFMYKRTDSTGSWFMIDTERSEYNEVLDYLLADSSAAEVTTGSLIDVVSNGININYTIDGTYTYAAFAESPFKYALAR